MQLYTALFNDDKIKNPELKENLINKIEKFVSNKTLLKYYEKNVNLLNLLFQGILKHMAIENMSYAASELMVEIIKPLCFSERGCLNDDSRMTEVTKQFFERNLEIFLDFMDNYNKLINKIMTNYTSALTDCVNVIKIKLAFY
jgi:hypothetical protein